jgi:hypothetical protein
MVFSVVAFYGHTDLVAEISIARPMGYAEFFVKFRDL